MKFIFDTNIAIYFLDGALTPTGFEFVIETLKTKQSALSLISKIEMLGFQFPNLLAEQKAVKFAASLPVLPLTDAVADKAIEIRKARKIKIGDAIIAATALVHNLTVVTRNEKDFIGLAGLSLVNPFSGVASFF